MLYFLIFICFRVQNYYLFPVPEIPFVWYSATLNMVYAELNVDFALV